MFSKTTMRVLVTGGAGFIGSHIADLLLAEGHEVVVLDNFSRGSRLNVPSGALLVQGDIRDAHVLADLARDFHPEAICHQAAQIAVGDSVRGPAEDADINIVGTVNLLDLAVRSGIRKFVFASSGGVIYGDPEQLPVPETAPVDPRSPYGISKACGEMYVRTFGRIHGLSTVILRYANVYGERQSTVGEGAVIAIFCDDLLQNRIPMIHGDGLQTRDFVHVSDVARANAVALGESAPNGVYNIGTGVQTSIRDVYALVCQAAGTKIEPSKTSARPGDVRFIAVDIALAEKQFGWKPTMNLSEGMTRTYEWFKNQIDQEAARISRR